MTPSGGSATFPKRQPLDRSFTGADLAGADLTDANLSEAKLIGADLRGANLTGVIGADFRDAKNVPAKYLKD